MRTSQLFTRTSKSVPADETAKNAQLLIKAGYIHKEMAGVYSYLPLGRIVIDKISQIIRDEMNAIGGQEVLMSVLQPKELWQQTGRWDDKVIDSWFKTKLASGSELGIGLTHEEPITNMLKEYVSSYKDLPVYIYQISTKFRNELRAKSGILRCREFLMKDMYSFSRSQAEHDEFYELTAQAYLKIYERLGIGDITYRTFASGGIFSQFSDEFQTLSQVGEDTIYVHEGKRLAVNREVYKDDVLNQLGLDKAELSEQKAVEVGNIFALGSKYADDLKLYYTAEDGQRQSVIMGCYGIGISRLMGLLAEHFADDKGLIWPDSVAPAAVYLINLGPESDTKRSADELYQDLTERGVAVLYDDREARPGEKLADADLIGLPHRVVISQKTLSSSQLEYKSRAGKEAELISQAELYNRLGVTA